MHFGRRRALPPDSENLADSSIDGSHWTNLQPFEVILDSYPTRLQKSVCQSMGGRLHAIKPWPLQWRVIMTTICLNLICAAYQSVDSYSQVYPDSKIAANILLNNHTKSAWTAFYWIFAICAVGFNMSIIILLPFGWFRSRWQCPFLCLLIIVVPALVFAPFYAAVIIRDIWGDVAWTNACNGWDITAVVQGVRWADFRDDLIFVGMSTVVVGQGNFTTRLHRNSQDDNLYDFYITEAHHFTPPYTNFTYNTANTTYTIANVTTSYTEVPNLSFPSLGLELLDPSIPFHRNDDNTYPPSANLVYRNGTLLSNVLSTSVLRVGDCTSLKVCGMQGLIGAFQIALGVVMIEQFKASVYCTIPANETISL
jgi:hypothetical protein